MDKRIFFFGLFFLLFLFLGESYALDNVTYKHPTLKIQFEAGENWQRLRRPEDINTYEVMDPSGSIHVIVWATTTMQDAERYLRKMASMKDVIVTENDKPEKTMVNNSEAYVMRLSGSEQNKDVRTLLAAIAHGMSLEYPKENYLFLIQIWCPEEEYDGCRETMESIFKSMQIL